MAYSECGPILVDNFLTGPDLIASLPGLFLSTIDFVLSGGTCHPVNFLKATLEGPETPPTTPDATTQQPSERPSSASEGRFVHTPPVVEPRFPRIYQAIGSLNAMDPDRGLDLTTRQDQVPECLRRAWSNKEIARELGLSEATVKVHVRQIMRKLGASNRTQIVIITSQNKAGDQRTIPIPTHARNAAQLQASEARRLG